MTEHTFFGPGGEIRRRPVFEVRTDQIEVTSNLPRPDPNWEYTDAAGHHHAYATLDETAPLGQGLWCTWCDDYHRVHICKDCGEHLSPGSLPPSMFREFIPGMTHYLIDGIEVSPEEFNQRAEEERTR